MPQQRPQGRYFGGGTHNEQSYPYFSHVRFPFVAVGVGNPAATTYTLAQGTEVKAFNYAQGQVMSGAGFPGTIATPVDTNLIKQSETVAGETVKIYGISFMLDTEADAELTRQLMSVVSVRVGLNGDQQLYNLGPLQMLPGAGGLHGLGRTDVLAPALDTGFAMVGSMQNGLPGALNFFKLPTPIIWKPPGTSDSTLVITCRAERAVVVASQNRVAASGIQAFSAPANVGQVGTYSGGWFVLHSVTRAERSVNA